MFRTQLDELRRSIADLARLDELLALPDEELLTRLCVAVMPFGDDAAPVLLEFLEADRDAAAARAAVATLEDNFELAVLGLVEVVEHFSREVQAARKVAAPEVENAAPATPA